MLDWGKALVYCSKDEEDWQKAKELLLDVGIEIDAWDGEELPVGGCGAKIDIRSFGRDVEIPKRVYKIKVSNDDKETAESALSGKVLPICKVGLGL